MNDSIYKALMRYIDKRGCTLQELATATKVPYHTLTKIAQRRTIPRLTTTEKLLKYFQGRAAR
jgi:predicted transcriptional regulator